MNQRVQWLLFPRTFIVCLLGVVSCSDDILTNNELKGLFNDLSSRKLKENLTYDSIEKIEVNCNHSSGILVSIDFKEIFNGTIYSQGYFNDPKCRFVRPNSNAHHFAFNIPYDGCGSKPSCSICSSFDNILIIQNNNNNVQDELSTARKVTCEHGGEQREKTVFFKPFVVDMLEVIKVETSRGSVECWMDIGLGSPPHLIPLTSSVKLGQDLTFTINLKQTIEKWDANILRCYAYDNTNFDAKSTKILQISDENGCSLQKNIFGEWKKLEMEFASENTLTYYNTLKVFKFPDRSHVFLKCDIELCSDVCERNYDCRTKQSIKKSKQKYILSTTENPRISSKSKCYVGSIDPACRDEVNNAITTTAKPIPSIQCYPGSSDPACEQFMYGRIKAEHQRKEFNIDALNSNVFTPSNCFPGSRDSKCVDSINLKYSSEQKSTKAPAYLPPLTKKPLKNMGRTCNAGSNDPKCAQTPKTIIKTTSVVSCNPGSTDPNCIQEDPTPNTTVSPCISVSANSNCSQSSQTPTCFPGSSGPKCLQTTKYDVTTITPCYPGSTEPKCVQNSKVNIKSHCYRGSNDPKCLKAEMRTTDTICYPGSTDSRCRQVIKFTKAPEYLPPTTSGRITTRTKNTCYSGSTDPFCSQTIRTTPKPVAKATTTPLCFIGSTDPACLVNQETTTVKKLGSSKITTVLSCYPGSLDLNCPQTQTIIAALCSQGSNGPNCLRNTKQSSEFLKNFKGPAYLPPNNMERGEQQCHSGSTNPRCKVLTTPKPICFPGTNDLGCQKIKNTATKSTTKAKTAPKVQSNTINPNCYPGSKSPECQETESTTTLSNCYTGSLDPHCRKANQQGCYTGSKSPQCQPTTYLPTKNIPAITTQQSRVTYVPSTTIATDRPKLTTSIPISISTNGKHKSDCYPGSKSPKCQLVTHFPPKSIPNPVQQSYTTTPSIRCYPGSKNSQCIQTTRAPNVANTVGTPSCYPGSKDLRCPQIITTTKSPTTTKTECSAGSLEPECLNCYPGSQNPKCQRLPTTVNLTTTFGTNVPILNTTAGKPICYPGSLDPKCQRLPTTANLPTTFGTNVPILNTMADKPSCYPGTKNLRCTQIINITTKPITIFKCLPGSLDPICKNKLPTPNCYIGSTHPRCVNATQKPKSPCYPGSPDPRCSNVQPTPDCYPGSKSPKCQPPKVNNLPLTTTTARCYPGSSNPICAPTSTHSFKSTTNLTTARAKSNCLPGLSSPECLNCSPGSLEPRCSEKITTTKPSCYRGSPDPKCQPATYLPPLTTKNILKTTPKPSPVSTLPSICSQGSTDPRCKENVPTTTKPGCYLDSKGPECQLATYLPPINPITDQKTTPKSCYPGSTDSNCNKQQSTTPSPVCYPGSLDVRCSKTKITTKNQVGVCQPGSKDPYCFITSTTTPPIIPTTRKLSTIKPTSPYYCYPGSIDPRCPDAGYKGTSLVPATYLPPLQDVSYDRTIRASKLNLLNGINQLALNDDVFVDLYEDVDEVEEQQFLFNRNKRDAGSIHHKHVPSQSGKKNIYLTIGIPNAFTVA